MKNIWPSTGQYLLQTAKSGMTRFWNKILQDQEKEIEEVKDLIEMTLIQLTVKHSSKFAVLFARQRLVSWTKTRFIISTMFSRVNPDWFRCICSEVAFSESHYHSNFQLRTSLSHYLHALHPWRHNSYTSNISSPEAYSWGNLRWRKKLYLWVKPWTRRYCLREQN